MRPLTEQANPKTRDIDRRTSLEIVRLMNEEDQTVAQAVSVEVANIAEAVDAIAHRLAHGGRLFYVGTGTSGRLGVLDASECPPTFGVSADLVQGVIAGGEVALRQAVEAAEDDPAQGARDLEQRGVSSRDAVVAISASGNTPYTLGALRYAKQVGAAAISLSCNPTSSMAADADISIAPAVGPEVIAGSSRMKAGTAQKMILNMLSTGTMIRLGLVYNNLMSNLRATNEKLRRRAREILASETGISADEASRLFREANEDLKLALLIAQSGLDANAARELLTTHNGSVRRALESLGL
ncbi:MAG TPA: N-acetylmuramic acid 6-phosphate etherase [Blastocatellia bacterium]|nr:N-acetylmuramic acid 6-phosphate etherase [Blastocatellia bacterium]